MRTAYGFLGFMFILVVGGAFFFANRAHAPKDTFEGDSSPVNANTNMTLSLTSPAFEHNGRIPALYTCDGDNTSPEFRVNGTPEGSVSLALLVDDPDIPKEVKKSMGIEKFDHFTVFNIDPTTTIIPAATTPLGVVGRNGAGKNAYTGPCPPSQYEPKEHRYFFRLYALDTILGLGEGASQEEVVSAMQGHIIGEAVLIGRYERAPN